jgi:hypothetical protein
LDHDEPVPKGRVEATWPEVGVEFRDPSVVASFSTTAAQLLSSVLHCKT